MMMRKKPAQTSARRACSRVKWNICMLEAFTKIMLLTVATSVWEAPVEVVE
jgi:hypothetical protein